MTRFVFHIGPERTGSTYLQNRLAADRAALRARGAEYAEAPGGEARHDLHALLRQDGAEASLEKLFRAAEAAGAAVVLFSGATLYQLTAAEISRLKAALGAREPEFVFYIRRWSERLGSRWNHAIHSGGFQSLPEFYMSFFGTAEDSQEIDHSPVWTILADAFGRRSLRLVSYSNLADRGQDMYAHFVGSCLGIDGFKGAPSAGRWRASHSPVATELRRVCNEIAARAGSGAKGAVADLTGGEFVAVRAAIERNLETIEFNDQSGRFDSAYRRMTEFGDRMVGGLPASGLFKRSATTHPYARPDYLAEAGVAATLMGVCGN